MWGVAGAGGCVSTVRGYESWEYDEKFAFFAELGVRG